jgi:hypothetical protein
MARAEFLVIPKVSLEYLNLLGRQPLAVHQYELGSFLVSFSFSSIRGTVDPCILMPP